MREIAANAGFTHPDVNDIRVGLADLNRAHSAGAERLSIGYRLPVGAAVGRLEDAATRAAEVIDHRLRRHAGDGDRTPAAKRADVAPSQSAERVRLRSLLRA